MNKRFDLMGSVGAFYSEQTAELNTMEIRPLIGVRFHNTSDHRVLIGGLARFEYRNIYYTENESWTQSTRSRFRLEAVAPLNRQRFSENNVLYGLADAEVFVVMDEVASERYANRGRYRMGLGYRPSTTWRFELIFSSENTKNTINDDRKETTNLIRFRVKHFFKKKTPVTPKKL